MSSNERKITSNKDLKKILNNGNLIIESQPYIKKATFFNRHPCSLCYLIFGLISFTLALLLSELTLSYIIVLSLTIGVFSTIGLLIYFVEYMSYKKDLSKTTTEDTFEGVKITESVKGGRNSIIILMLFNVAFWIYVSVALVINFGGIRALLLLIIIWFVNGLFIFGFYRFAIKGTSQLRKFMINENFIQILLPPKPIFHVNWVDIEKIELRLKPYKKLMIPDYPTKHIYIHELNFIGKDYNQTLGILGGRDFGKKLNEIFDLLEKYAIKMNKEFIRFDT